MLKCSNTLMLWNWSKTGVFFCFFFMLWYCLFLKCWWQENAPIKYTRKTLCEKCQALKDLEKGESNKDVAATYNVPENTISTWVKNKEKLFDALKKGTKNWNQTIMNWWTRLFLIGSLICEVKMYHYQPLWLKKKQLILPKNGQLSGFRWLATTLEGKK